MVDFCRKMLPFSDDVAPDVPGESLERVVVRIGGRKEQKSEPAASFFSALGSRLSGKLEKAGFSSLSQVLQRGKMPAGRKDLADECGLSVQEVLTMVNYADLCRVGGIDVYLARLLEMAGVDTVPELSHRNPGNLHKKLSEVNRVEKLVEQTPPLEDVTTWIAAAKELPRQISY